MISLKQDLLCVSGKAVDQIILFEVAFLFKFYFILFEELTSLPHVLMVSISGQV